MGWVGVWVDGVWEPNDHYKPPFVRVGCVSTGTNAPAGRDLHMMTGGGLPVAEAGGMMRDGRVGGGGSPGAAWAGYWCGHRACAAAPHASRVDWHRPDPPHGSGRFVMRRKTGLPWMNRASVRPAAAAPDLGSHAYAWAWRGERSAGNLSGSCNPRLLPAALALRTGQPPPSGRFAIILR